MNYFKVAGLNLGIFVEKQRLKTIFVLSVPIIGGMISQNILNIVDTAMVGSLGDASLAAVGMGGFITFMCQSMILGLAAGVQAMSSRRKGEGKDSETAIPLNAGIVVAIAAGIPMSIVLYFLAGKLFPLLNNDANVLAAGVPYLEARMLGITAVGINFAFRGYWNGINRSQMYLRSILLMHVCNVILNYTFIYGNFGFEAMGAKGSGLGTSIALYIGSAYYIVLGLKEAKPQGFFRRLPKLEELTTLLRVTIPNGIQTFTFAAGFTALYWIIGLIGTAELAAANVIINISLVCILPGIGFGLTAASLVGQALGRNDKDDAMQWGWDVVKVGVLTLGTLGLPIVLFPELILSGFIHDQSTIDIALLPLRLAGIAVAIEGVGLVLLNAQLGAGDSKRVMVVSTVIQWLIFLPVAYYVGPVLGLGLTAVWICQLIYRLLFSGSMAAMWNHGKWATIKV